MNDQFGDWIQLVKGPRDQAAAEARREQSRKDTDPNSSKNRKERRESKAFGASIVGLTANVIALAFIGWQSCATQQSVNVAQASLATSAKQMRIQQRAWIGLNGFVGPQDLFKKGHCPGGATLRSSTRVRKSRQMFSFPRSPAAATSPKHLNRR